MRITRILYSIAFWGIDESWNNLVANSTGVHQLIGPLNQCATKNSENFIIGQMDTTFGKACMTVNRFYHDKLQIKIKKENKETKKRSLSWSLYEDWWLDLGQAFSAFQWFTWCNQSINSLELLQIMRHLLVYIFIFVWFSKNNSTRNFKNIIVLLWLISQISHEKEIQFRVQFRKKP